MKAACGSRISVTLDHTGFVNVLEASLLWHTRGLNTPASANRYKNHRFPVEIISHGV
jgi:hypothetical protein